MQLILSHRGKATSDEVRRYWIAELDSVAVAQVGVRPNVSWQDLVNLIGAIGKRSLYNFTIYVYPSHGLDYCHHTVSIHGYTVRLRVPAPDKGKEVEAEIFVPKK